MPDAYFNSCSKLETLNIASNKLTAINTTKLAGLASIRYLYFEYNTIGDIDGDFIWDHPAMYHLSLNGNSLTQLPSLVTNGVSMLRHLSVGYNKINQISESQVRHLQRLRQLDISNNNITNVDFVFILPNVQELRLGNNPIPFTEYLLDNMTHLSHVDLHDSDLVAFPLLSTSKTSLTYIRVSENKISCIDVLHLTNLTKLQSLYITYNDIEGFPDYGCKEGNNSINTAEDVRFPSLRHFDIRYNQLRNVSRGLLSKMPLLYSLYASNNLIVDMPFISIVGVSLEYVSLEYNKIRYINSSHVSGLANLRRLDLQYNKLSTVPMIEDLDLGGSVQFIVDNNPYICDSRICADPGIDGLRCGSPAGLAGKTFEYAMEVLNCGKYDIMIWPHEVEAV